MVHSNKDTELRGGLTPRFGELGKVAFGWTNGVCTHKSTTCYSVSSDLGRLGSMSLIQS